MGADFLLPFLKIGRKTTQLGRVLFQDTRIMNVVIAEVTRF